MKETTTEEMIMPEVEETNSEHRYTSSDITAILVTGVVTGIAAHAICVGVEKTYKAIKDLCYERKMVKETKERVKAKKENKE